MNTTESIKQGDNTRYTVEGITVGGIFDIPKDSITLQFNAVREENGVNRSWIDGKRGCMDGVFIDARYKLMELATEIGLKKLSESNIACPELRDWAKQVCEMSKEVAEKAIASDGRNIFSFVVDTNHGKEEITLNPCTDGWDKPKSLSDIEYYLVSDEVIESGSNLYEIIGRALCYDALEKRLDNSKDELQKFYEETIRPIEDKMEKARQENRPANLTEEEEEARGTFSDWHKDIYGHRPRTGNNECEKIYKENIVNSLVDIDIDDSIGDRD